MCRLLLAGGHISNIIHEVVYKVGISFGADNSGEAQTFQNFCLFIGEMK